MKLGRIDWFLATSNIIDTKIFEIIDCRVYSKTWQSNKNKMVCASDHFPLILTLRVNPPKQDESNNDNLTALELSNSKKDENRYLRSNKNGTVDLAPHIRKHEQWKCIDLGINGKFCFKSHHNTYLRANKNGTVDCAPHCKSHEIWTISAHPQHGTFSWKSHFNSYLKGNNDGKVVLGDQCDSSAQWRHVPVKK